MTPEATPSPLPDATPEAPAAAKPVSTALSQLSGVARTSFDDSSAARADQIPTYKGKKDVTDRIALLDTSLLLVGRYHYHKGPDDRTPGLGYVLCKSHYQRQGEFWVLAKQARCCEALGESKIRCVTPVIKYTTDRAGNVVKPFDYSLMAWVFNPQIMDTLQGVRADFNLNEIDLKITCTDEQFQKITILPAPNRVVSMPQVQEQYGQTIRDWMAAVIQKLPKLIGREVSDADLLAKLGASGGNTGTGSVQGGGHTAPQAPPDDIADLFK